jgi:hypothetical protein
MAIFHHELTDAEHSRSHCPSFTVLQTSRVCPVFESITVVTGRQLQVTVLAFSCLTTTQCSMSSAVGGGSWLRMGGGVAATGCFFAAQPARSKQNTRQAFLIHPFRSLWPTCRWQSWLHAHANFQLHSSAQRKAMVSAMGIYHHPPHNFQTAGKPSATARSGTQVCSTLPRY